MKTLEEKKAFIEEIKAVCEKNRIGIVGTDDNESIYGEITLVDLDNMDSCGWKKVEDYLYNFNLYWDCDRTIV